jgi:hypothetical protein
MASLIDDTEDAVVLGLSLVLVGLCAWALYKGWSLLQPGADAGKAQSLKNALNGFPDGADPGTIPAAQYLQGIVESVRNFHDYVFGSDEDNAADSAPSIPAAYQAPTAIQMADTETAVDDYDQWASSDESLGNTVTNWGFKNLF